MLIENVMYFALGLLVASLIALIMLPAVWKRAVRLTKRRIEAATPITLAEFRADKDQLRAEFALSTRRLEINVETLRKRLAEQLGDVNQKRNELVLLKAERDKNLEIIAELESRGSALRSRVTELEREATDLTQRLRMRERDLAQRAGERDTLPRTGLVDGHMLTGDYEQDIERLGAALLIEQKRAGFLEDQAKSLVDRLETSDRRSAETNAAIARMRAALAERDDSKASDTEGLVAAEARMASAENRLNAILAESQQVVDRATGRAEHLLADKLALEAEVETLRKKVLGVESSIMADWDNERLEEAYLREKLNDIAASVSRLVYAVDTDTPVTPNPEESLFDRVQRFADDGESRDALPADPMPISRRGSVSDRMAALREIQDR
jgi:chromosome segregation ATPase